MSSLSKTQDSYPYPHLAWSKSEIAIARKTFDRALRQELNEVMQEAKRRTSQIKEPDDLWDLESFLTQRRKEINRKYDYRYSQLTEVFARLLHEGRVGERELNRLAEDKLKSIRPTAEFLAKMDAA